jgi:hypothetical protein
MSKGMSTETAHPRPVLFRTLRSAEHRVIDLLLLIAAAGHKEQFVQCTTNPETTPELSRLLDTFNQACLDVKSVQELIKELA